jgi:hypothetical protein
MEFKQTNRTGAEAVYIICRNITGAAVSAGVPVEWDVVTATDGNAVTAAKSGSSAGLFVGVAHTALADSAYGPVQVYGFRQSAYVSSNSADSPAPGTFLQPTNGRFEIMTMSAATTSGHINAVLMETVATSSALAQRNIFLRCM